MGKKKRRDKKQQGLTEAKLELIAAIIGLLASIISLLGKD